MLEFKEEYEKAWKLDRFGNLVLNLENDEVIKSMIDLVHDENRKANDFLCGRSECVKRGE